MQNLFVMAHGGHGPVEPHFLAHYVFSAEHAIPTVIGVVVLSILASRWMKERRSHKR